MTPCEAKNRAASAAQSHKKSYIAAAAFGLASVLASSNANAGATIKIDDDKSVSLGLAMKYSITNTEGGAPDGSRSTDFNLDSARILLGGQLNNTIKATFNTDISGNNVVVLDALAQFEFADAFNVWIGRMITPGDRANMSGGYYQSTYYYPGVVSNYPGNQFGRDDGATIWGKFLDKKLVYSFGVFRGHNRGALGPTPATTPSNTGSNPLFVGRLQYSLLDAELDPAYFTSSTYYGGAGNILTIGVAGNVENDGVGTAAAKADYKAWNVDLLFESKMAAWGSVTVEGAFYDYDTNNVPDPLAGQNLKDGKAYFASAAYTLPGKYGWGLLQPYVRFQEFDADITSATETMWNLGVNYVIAGHNAKVSLDYGSDKKTALPATDKVTLGLILQF